MFTLLTHHRPVETDNVADLLRKTLQGEIRRPRELSPQIPKPLDAICRKALADDLECFLAGEKVDAYPGPWTDWAGRWVRKHRTMATSALAAGLLVVTDLNRKLDDQNTQLADANAKALRWVAEQREQEVQVSRTEASIKSLLIFKTG